MVRFVGVLMGLAVALPLAGCNETAVNSAPMMSASAAPVHHLPPGAPCSDEIDQYHAIVASDRDTGNLEQKVYDQIDQELSRASAACSAGRSGEAHSLVAASKARHGYREG